MSDDLTRALTLLDHKRPWYDEYRDYYNGIQPIMFATRRFLAFYEQVMRRYRLNICRPVVKQVSRRLSIDAWEATGDSNSVTEWWEASGQLVQNRLYRESVRQGDGYLLVWPQGTMQGELKINRLRADEAIVVYREGEPDTPEYGVKKWVITNDEGRERTRVNVYHTDRVVRWVSAATQGGGGLSWQPYTEDGVDAELMYDGSLKEAGQDGILPIQHFPSNPDDTPYGTSVLEDVVPIQDALNKHAIDILVTSEQYGLPLRAALGMEYIPESYQDDDGNLVTTSNLDNIEYDPRIDHFLALPGENSRLIQLPQADTDKLLEVKRAAIQDAALVSGVPLLLLAEDTGNVPTGVALREVKAPLAELVEDVQQDQTVPWHNVARLYGWDAQPVWSAPFQMDEAERWELAKVKIEAGYPLRQAFIETGLSDEFVDRVIAEAESVERDVGRRLLAAERAGEGLTL